MKITKLPRFHDIKLNTGQFHLKDYEYPNEISRITELPRGIIFHKNQILVFSAMTYAL